jgi:hypothetical protein
MKLSEFPARKQVGKPSVVDQLPDEIRQQLIDARLAGTHSVGAMCAWAKAEGYENVTSNALSNWFQTRGYQAGGGAREA